MSNYSQIRFRGHRKDVVEIAKQFDAFKKIPEKYTESSRIGGFISIISRLLIVYLIYQEITNYLDATLKYAFKPDLDMDDKIKLHVDITIATSCMALSGVDLVDETQQDIFTYGPLKRENTYWEMSPDDRDKFEHMQSLNSFLREEFHSVANILFKDLLVKDVEPPTTLEPLNQYMGAHHKDFDACRLYGSLSLNKVAGVLNFVTGGSAILQFGTLHIHLEDDFNGKGPANFSHRINRLSFGDFSRRLVQPLEGDESILGESSVVQYFIKVVPTEIQNVFSTVKTFQYSVTENIRKLPKDGHGHSTPGIYFKYDFSPLKVIVFSDRENLIQFIVHLCSIISGVIVISGIINSLLRFLTSILSNAKEAEKPLLKEAISPVASPIITGPNNLIQNADNMATEGLVISTTVAK